MPTLRPAACRWHDSIMRRIYGTWEPSPVVRTETLKRLTRERQSRKTLGRGGMLRNSDDGTERCSSEGGMLSGPNHSINWETGRNW